MSRRKKRAPRRFGGRAHSQGLGELFLEEVHGHGDVRGGIGYDGYLTIEREVGPDPAADIAMAVNFLKEKLA